MTTRVLFLTAEEVAAYSALTSYREKTEFVTERLPIDVLCGYGYYGLVSAEVKIEEMEYWDKGLRAWTTGVRSFLQYYTGKSCD